MRPLLSRCAPVLLFALSACTCSPAPPAVTRRPLVTLPENYRPKSIFISDDGEEAVFTIREADGDRLVRGGQPGPLLKEIGAPRMAPQTRRVFYWALDLADGKRAIYLGDDDQRVLTGFDRTGELVFSRDGRRWAAVGGVEIAHDDGRRERGPVLLFADGTPAGSYADASRPTFSPDGAHMAQLIDDGRGVALFVDGVEQRRLAAPPPSSGGITTLAIGATLNQQYDVRYLADGSLLTVEPDADGWAVKRGDTRLGSYAINVRDSRQSGVTFNFGDLFKDRAGFVPSTISTAAAAPVAAWWVREPGDSERWHVVRDGKPESEVCARYWSQEPPLLSADGKHLAYGCHRTAEGQPEQVDVIVDGRRFGPYTNAWGMAFSPDGTRFAFGADDGSAERPWFYVVDGQPHGMKFDRVFPPRFSPDGRHVAWVAERKNRLVLFLDGDGYASSDDLLWAPTFDLGKGLSWAVLRGRRVSRVDIGPLP